VKTDLLAQQNHVLVKEVEIFEHKKHQTSGNNAHNQQHFLFSLFVRLFDINTRYIIDQNGDQQYQNVLWNKEHVKHTTSNQQMQPAEFVGQQIEQDGYNGEKQNEFEGVEQHIFWFLLVDFEMYWR
jgi:hypothetical protein